MNFQNTETQIKSCIVSKARFALGLKNTMPIQNVQQRCTQEYWLRTIDTICLLKDINNRARRQSALDRFDGLINN